MKKTINISVADPCHEDWSKMTPTEKGRHCTSCEKEVVDFTQKSDEELFTLIKNGASLCGRFKSTQLDRDLKLSRKRNNSLAQYAASLLIPAAILSTQDIKAQQKESPTSQVQKKYTSLGIGTHHQTFKKRFDPFAFDTIGIVYANGTPVKGAQVSIKDSDRTTLTAAKGTFVLEALPGEILIIALDGFDTQEIAIDENSPKYKVQMGIGIVKGQTFTVTGTISDVSGGLPGAHVTIKGTSRKTATDFDGNYSIDVKKGDILLFSYVGYETEEALITTNPNVSAVLRYSDEMIQGDIIVVGMIASIEPKDSSIHKPKLNTTTHEQKQVIAERKKYQEKVNAWKRFKNKLKKQASKKKD